jgi:hypothetical protein
VVQVTAATEARLLNWFAERAESVDDRRAISLVAKVLDGDDDAMVAAYNAWMDDGGTTGEFYRAIVQLRKSLDRRTETSDVAKALGAVRGLQVEELEGAERNGFICWKPHPDGITGPDGDGMAKLLAGTMWPDSALDGLTG